ncbi:CAP domain-containing protein [Rubrobacter taiwanensis]|jgi:uncharacterized protein YkwD|uniref:CAP domain-containing protein n=2 Tax=Rubrobacter taiwanensis TaxID=185139 RepID=A0A4R1BHQ5_9ACTN|nr:CAP domain-containing protein [Rubrobacter taiwanensis]
MLLIALLVLLGAVAVRGESARAQSYDAEELRFLELINEYRQTNGLDPLLLSDTLSVAAERHSEDMGRYGFVAHDTLASSYYPAGTKFHERMAAEGYAYNTYKAENIAAGLRTAGEVFAGWRDSPGHDANMLDPRHRVIGIGRAYVPGSRHGWYWTTNFGAEADPSVRGRADGALDPADWVQRSAGARELIADGRAHLGGYAAGRDVLQRRVELPGDRPRLSYRVRVAGGEESSGELRVQILNRRGERLATLRAYGAEDAGRVIEEDIGLSRFAGREVVLRFEAVTGEGPAARFVLHRVRVGAPDLESEPQPAEEELIISRD